MSSRNAAAGWGCFIHNEVNAMLEKPEFDCNKIGDFYDCGCSGEDEDGDGDGDGDSQGASPKKERDAVGAGNASEEGE